MPNRTDPMIRSWIDRHCGKEISMKGVLRKHKIGRASLLQLVWDDKPPPRPSRSNGKVAAYLREWAERRLPTRMQGLGAEDIAQHYRITAAAVRIWALKDLPPRVGGYDRHKNRPPMNGPNARGQFAKQRDEAVKVAVAHPKLPKAERLPAFMAELHERQRNSLSRVFLAELSV